MKSFIRNKKLMAWVVLLTFLFSCVMPSNIMGGNSIAEAAISGANNVEVGSQIELTDNQYHKDWNSWTSSNSSIAKVTGNGSKATVTGVAPGTVTVTHTWWQSGGRHGSGYWDTNTYTVTVTAANNTPEITGDVDISKTGERIGADEWLMTMTIGADSQTIDNTLNIVLVMDRSNSMTKDMMDSSKTAAKNFVTTLSTKKIPANVAVVEFGTDGYKRIGLTQIATAVGANDTNVDSVNSAIDGIKRNGGGTNLQHGLILADELLAGKNNAYIVILSDGQPTYYMVQDNGRWSKRGEGTTSWISTSSTKTEDYVNTYLKTNANLKIVTIAFGDLDNSTKNYYAGLSSDSAKLYFAGGVNDIDTIFGNIASQILYLMESGSVTDNMDNTTVSDVDIVLGENGTLDANEYTVNNGTVAIEDGKLVWTISDAVTRDEPAKLTYTVKAKEILVGKQSPFLNGQADLTYKDSNDEEYNDRFENPIGVYEAAQLAVSYDGLPEAAPLPWTNESIADDIWQSDVVITDWENGAVKVNPEATMSFETVKDEVYGYYVDTVTVTQPDGTSKTMTLAEFKADYANNQMDIVTGTTTVVYHYVPVTMNVTVTKVWNDNNNQDGIRPETITVYLKQETAPDTFIEKIKALLGLDRAEVLETAYVTADAVTVTAKGNWVYTFENLPKYENGSEINYIVEEGEVEGYTAEIKGDAATGFEITNTHAPETVAVEGAKTWNDNNDQDGKRPESITVNLLADGKVIDTETVTGDDWAYSFTDLPKYRDQGTSIVYSIAEEAVANYTTTYNGYNITNTHTPEKINISGTKTWNDAYNQDGKRPTSITVNLYANGGEEPVATATVTAETGWKYEFKGVDKYAGGQEITYTVEEITVDGYTTAINGFAITNTHEVEKTSVSGTKTWNDADNQDGKRPASITVRLHADGKVIDTKVVKESDDWKYSFTDLDKYKNGKEIVYTITEDVAKDYTTTVDGYNIINDYTPAKTSVAVTKVWEDKNNQDGIRPNDVTVELVANNAATGKTVTLNADNNWTASFADLDEYANGVKITYTVKENAVEGYNTAITGDAATGYIVTNTHETETTSVSGTKTWDDANNQDGKRPESITVNLLANGEQVATKEVKADANGNWTYTFENVDKYAGGQEITYTVNEEVVDGYTPTYAGMNITNTHEVEKIEVSGSKTWNDADNQDGKRPESITVNLLANGKQVATKEVKADASGNWTYTFENVDKYAGGQEIIYTVTEEAVAGYTPTYDGMNITNTHVPEVTSVTVTKAWDDANNQDGIRTNEVQVQLRVNDTVIRTGTVKAVEEWKYTFENLPKYADGKEIKYTITETAVAGYTAEVNGYDITNTHTPETIKVDGAKTWNDNNNQDGKRPESITVNLLADGNVVDTKTVTAANGWKYSFTDLPKYKVGAVKQAVVYTITEDTVAGYTASYNGYNITNTHTPETIDVPVAKVWADSNNQDGKRPADITVELYKGNVRTENSLTLNAGNNWSAAFEDLAKYENGVEVNYSVREAGEDDNNEINFNGATYTVKHAVNDEGVYTITNSYTPEVTKVSVTKVWSDANNQDGQRPTSVTVQLKANGVNEGAAVTLDDANHWTYEWTGLAKYAAGEVITYTVEETNVKAGYTPSITGTMAEGYTITNSYTPETTSVSGEKTWIDKGNESLRPSSITVNLYADGAKYGEKTVKANAEGKWQYTFENLPKYKDGAEIAYTVTEEPVDKYNAAYNGYNIVNTIAQDYLSIHVDKAWDKVPVDANGNQILPEEIVLVVTQDGAEYRSQTVTAADEWKYTFANLPKYDVDGDGHKYKYALYEKPVNGYVPTYAISKVATNDGTEQYLLNITNTYVDNNNVVNVVVNKVWQTGAETVPDITVNLMQSVSSASGAVWEKVDEVVLKNGETNYTFTNLPKYYKDQNGNTWNYMYKVTENPVDGYTTSITGDVENGFTIYNTAKDFGKLVVSKTATGDNRPAADTKYDFVLLIDAGEVDIDLLARQNGMRAEANKLADEAAAATAALQTAEANFKATTLITTASEYQFIFYNDHHEAMYGFGGTTPGVYDFHTHDHGFVVGVHNDSANILESIIDAIVQAVKNVFARMGSAFDIPAFMNLLEEETSNISTTPSALAFHFGNTVDFMHASREAELAHSRAEVAANAVTEFDTTTPSAITVTFGDTTLNLTPSEKDQYFNDEAKYYIVPFSLASGENLGFDIEAVNTEGKDTTIKYMVVEQNKYQTDFENTTITVSAGETTKVLDDNMTAWTELTTGSAYSYAFTNMYSNNVTPPPPSDPEPPVTPPDPPTIPDPEPEPEDIEIPEEEVPLAEPGIEIEEPEVPLAEPEVPLGDAPPTGDTTNAVPFLCMLLVGLVGFLVSRTKFN